MLMFATDAELEREENMARFWSCHNDAAEYTLANPRYWRVRLRKVLQEKQIRRNEDRNNGTA